MEGWGFEDRRLAFALAHYEAKTTHGVSTDKAYSKEDGEFLEAEKVINYAAAAIAKKQKEQKTDEPGAEYFVRDIRDDPDYEEPEGYGPPPID